MVLTRMVGDFRGMPIFVILVVYLVAGHINFYPWKSMTATIVHMCTHTRNCFFEHTHNTVVSKNKKDSQHLSKWLAIHAGQWCSVLVLTLEFDLRSLDIHGYAYCALY